MKTRNAAIFLIISSVIWLAAQLYIKIYSLYEFNWNDTSKLTLVLYSALAILPVFYLLIGFSYLKPNPELRKKTAIGVVVMLGIWIGLELYYRVLDPLITAPTYPIINPFKYYFTDNLFFIFLFAAAFMGVAWIRNNQRMTRRAAGWLIAGSLIWIFDAFAQSFYQLIMDQYEYDTIGRTLFRLAHPLAAIFPVSLVALCISILKGEQLTPEAETQVQKPATDNLDDVLGASTEKAAVEIRIFPTPIDWLSDLLAASIPLFGTVFLIWRGHNNTRKNQRNWSLAVLFWQIIGIPLNIICFLALLDESGVWVSFTRKAENVLLIAVLVFVLLLIIWGLLMQRRKNNDFDDDLEHGSIPSVWDWVGLTFVAAVPLLGIICLIVWAIDGKNPKKSWSVAMLLRMAVSIVFYIYIYAEVLEMRAFNNRSLWDL